jgi:hypothetical protein
MLRAATGLVLNELIDRLGGANRLALPPMASAPNAPFNLAAGVLNRVCCAALLFMRSTKLATSRFSATGSLRNSSLSESECAGAVMTECIHLREPFGRTDPETALLEVS